MAGAVENTAQPFGYDAQLAAARAAAPAGWRAQTFQPAFTPGETARITFKPGPAAQSHSPGLTVFVDPTTGSVLGQLDEADRLMNTVKTLHGSLLAGKAGEYVVELAASWALVLFLTGVYLAWPRPHFTLRGFLLPRLRATGRTFWRDLHAVPALWCAVGTIFLLSTGLLWTNVAGQWYRTVSAALGQGTPRETAASAHRSELTGWSPPLKTGLAQTIDALASTPPPDSHAGHRPASGAAPSAMAGPDGPFDGALPLDRVVALARERGVPEPFAVGLPVGPRGVFSAISDRNQPFNRAYVHIDQYSGRILADVRFRDLGYLAQAFSWGIIAHEGRLFGVANQIIGTLAAAGLVLLGATGLGLWWQRRPAGQFAAPVSSRRRLPRLVWLGLLALAILLPLLAVSLLALLAIDRWGLRRFRFLSTDDAAA